MLLELLKLLFSLSVDIIMMIVQSIIAAVSLLLLYRTIKLQNKANETQASILMMEMKAKRAEYMPSLDVTINSDVGNWVDDGFGGTMLIGFDRTVNVQINVKENPLTQFSIHYHKPDGISLVDFPIFNFQNSFYKPGEKMEFNLFEYDIEDVEKIEINIGFSVTITYEDLIGNRYEQKIFHYLTTNKSEQFPVSLSR